MSKANSVLV